MILAERAARLEAEAGPGTPRSSGARLEIERLRLLLARDAARAVRPDPPSAAPGSSSSSSCSLPSSRRAWRKRRRQPRSPPRRLSEPAAIRRHPQAGPPAAAGAPAARAHRLSGALRLPQVRRPGPQAGRGRDRDPGVRAAALEGGRACAGEGQLPLAARRSASRRRPRTRSPVAGPGPTCWPWCWPRSTASTCR